MRGLRHRVTISTPSGTATYDAEGFATPGTPTTQTSVPAYVAEADAAEIVAAGYDAQAVDLVVHVEGSVSIDETASVVVTTPTNLAGTYQVEFVRTHPQGRRVFCRRSTAVG